MEKKNIVIGAGIAAATVIGLGLYYYLTYDQKGDCLVSTREEILEKLGEEVKEIQKPEKIAINDQGSSGIFYQALNY